MGDPSRPDSQPSDDGSLPPSQPRPDRSLPDIAGLGEPSRLGRWQRIGGVAVGILLIAVPLYFWRRPRAVVEGQETKDAAPEVDAAAPPAAAPEAPDAAADAGPPGASVGPARILECHDSGAKRTAPVDCDHLPPLEAAIGNAILATASCVPKSSGGGTVEYVIDVSFARKRTPFYVTAPREGRTLKNAHVAAACAVAVKRALSSAPLDLPHQHGRYKLAVSATYP